MHRKLKDAGPAGLQHKQFGFKVAGVAVDGARAKFSGYGSVFGNEDSYGEIVAPGAFAKSLAEIKAAKRIVPALWQHRSGEPIGGFPDLSEDAYGLKVTDGFLLRESVVKAAEAYALMDAGVVTGMSIGYYVRKSSYDEKTGIRTLTELDLVEISIVTFPANSAAQVTDVKSRIAAGKATVRQVEEFLRDAGFTKTVAAGMAGSYGAQVRRDSDSKNSQDVLAALRGITL